MSTTIKYFKNLYKIGENGYNKKTHGTDREKKAANSMEITIKEGNYERLGAYLEHNALIFTFEGEREDDCAILFYEKNTGKEMKVEIPEEYCLGSLRSVKIEGLYWKDYNYNYVRNGEIYTDPYARKIVGRECWGDENREKQNYRICGGFEKDGFDWKKDHHPEIAKSDMILYKLHVRGFTMDGGARGGEKGTFAGVTSKIPYLKELGITTVEVMPVYEFEEFEFETEPQLPDYLNWVEREDDKIKKPVLKKVKEHRNFWGYTKESNYFAVKASYGKKNATVELKELIRTLHENEMELVMEFYFDERENHNLILDVLRYWLREFHVDGFHLLGKNLPVTAIVQDAILSRTKIFYTGFDYALLEKKTNYDRLYVYNDEYLYPVRKMLNHYGGNMNEFAGQQRKQHEVQGFVNYLTSNNGFTLLDLFSYEQKHNEENGEENTDGNDWNFSSNCGAEGKTTRKHVREFRECQLKNAIAVLFLGQAVPLLWSGDELGNSQQGNNNAYCQDNEIGWINWKGKKRYQWLTEFVSKMIAFRKVHPILTMAEPMKMNDYANQGMPDLSYHCESAWTTGVLSNQQSLGVMYCGKYAKKEDGSFDNYIYVAYNFHVGDSELALPKLPRRKKWYLVMNTGRTEAPFLEQEEVLKNQQKITVKGQTVSILIGR